MRTLTRRRFIAITAAGAAAVAVSAACGDDGDDTDGADDAGSTPSSSPTAAPAASPTVDAGADQGAVGLQWFGQSMFLLTSPGGTTVLLDPFGEIGYTLPPPLDSDAATITHEHPDHSNDALAGSATVLRGLTADGWTEIDQTIGDVRILAVPTFHDAVQGAERGRNAAFVFETAGLRLAHLGDLGHTLSDEQRTAIGPVDALMVPVGGGFTLDAAGATEVTNQLQPKIVFPMHYKTDAIAFPIATADAFLAGKTVQRTGSTTLRIAPGALPAELTTYVLDYE
jgi:L-ascorbate metabolism protein UlaG (beta-lactamase superfamily)